MLHRLASDLVQRRRLRHVASALVRDSEVKVGRGALRLELARLLEGFGGLVELVLPQQERARR
eukprot:scaffold38796_cov65-Phaeocystis_antarctica.AAC.7